MLLTSVYSTVSVVEIESLAAFEANTLGRPCGPCGPCSPCRPCGPCSPVSPLSPLGPWMTAHCIATRVEIRLDAMIAIRSPAKNVVFDIPTYFSSGGMKPSLLHYIFTNRLKILRIHKYECMHVFSVLCDFVFVSYSALLCSRMGCRCGWGRVRRL